MTNQPSSNLRIGMTFMASIFFIFGFITNFNIAMKDQVQLAFDLKTLYPGWENFFCTTCKWRIFLCIFLFQLYIRHDYQENWL